MKIRSFVNELVSKDTRKSLRKERPLRAHNYTQDQLAELGVIIADQDSARTSFRSSKALKARFHENVKILEAAYATLAEAARNKEILAPGAEWLLDNFHVVEQHVREIKRYFPVGYDRTLPKLTSGDYVSYPRVYRLALEVITHCDAVVDTDLLTSFLSAFQSKTPLTSGELWAIPIMLKFALIENLRRLITGIIDARLDRNNAEVVIQALFQDANVTASDLPLRLNDIVKQKNKILAQGGIHVLRRLRERGSKGALAVQWLETKLKESGLDPDEIIREDYQSQALDQVSIGNSVTSLRTMSSIDWRTWFESMSVIDKILRQDPVGIYSKCDFNTRDMYRHEIEKISRKTGKTEIEIAESVLLVASHSEEKLGQHVGYHLIDKGAAAFKSSVGLKKNIFESLVDPLRKNPLLWYLGSIMALTTFFVFMLASIIGQAQTPLWLFFTLIAISVIPASDLAQNIFQWLINNLSSPYRMPKLSFEEEGVPDEHRTLVAVHGIFADTHSLTKSLEGLEVRFLANEDKNFTYALLADLTDASTETTPQDEEILNFGRDYINELNQKYSHDGKNSRFLLLFRKRLWNPSQNCFMAWERKRGKITELNRIILGEDDTTFFISNEEKELLRTCKYVITLDSDTQLPGGSARKLVGAMAHPLNRPVIDPKSRRVTRGYGILQPRVGVSLSSANSTIFSSIFAGQAGLDPYTNTVSDVYQDLFSESSYVGKGIYDVYAFEESLRDRVPENTLLSHDLFEGNYARAGLVSDIEVFDEFPTRYRSFAKRQHRWVRGDWQLIQWLFPIVPTEDKNGERNPLSLLGWWKILDNLRRSLLGPCLLAFISLAWIFIPSTPILWLALAFIVIAFPVYTNLASVFVVPPLGLSLSIYARGLGYDILKNTQQAFFSFAFLPHNAWLMIDAIVTTLFRVFISRKNLLEWQTAHDTEKSFGDNLAGFFYSMFPAVVLGGLIGTLIYHYNSQNFNTTLPLIICWLVSPYLAYGLRSSPYAEWKALAGSQKDYIEQLGFDTWKYFRDNLNDEHNYLIPDNLQLVPTAVLAPRTSPTNISLSLLSVLSAYDCGFSSLPISIERWRKTFESLAKLERFQGHFLNWYDTQRLAPLHPRYVSSVDSGNFVGHLFVLRDACSELIYKPLVPVNHLEKLFKFNHIKSDPNFNLNFSGGSSAKDIYTLYLKTEEIKISIGKEKFEEYVNSIPDLSILLSLKDFVAWVDPVQTLINSVFKDKYVNLCKSIEENLDRPLSIGLIAELQSTIEDIFEAIDQETGYSDLKSQLASSWLTASTYAQNLYNTLNNIKSDCTKYIEEANFNFLYDSQKNLLIIGYNVDDSRKDNSSYDLLASEARLPSLVAIAKGDIPLKHWFSLGRGLADTPGGKALLSWSGTMFEYFMPLVVMKDYPGTLLSETYRSVIEAQRKYAARRGVPWGISESAYSGVDLQATYQYRAFGVPGLGLKRGLENDLVVSPYSCILALPIAPQAVLTNLKALEGEGLRGDFGFYEAVDYTKDRLSSDEKKHVVKSCFAHHQGMSFLTINNVLNNGILQNRFHNDLMIKAVELLLHERFPQRVTLSVPHQAALSFDTSADKLDGAKARIVPTAHTAFPITHVLSNGRLTTMIDNAGSGFTRFEKDISLTRWKEDSALNAFGLYLFIRDVETSKVWSATYQPTRVEPDTYEWIGNSDKIEVKRRDNKIFSHLEVTVAPEDDVEIRRLTLSNLSSRKRTIEITSYAEVVLGHTRGDAFHPAFAKMFLESEFVSDLDTLIFSRRPRSVREAPLFMFHRLSTSLVWDRVQYESSRADFLGRGNSVADPFAMHEPQLSSSVGFILDPVMSLRTKIELDPNQSHTLSFVTGVGRSRDEVLNNTLRYQYIPQINRAFEMAWSRSSVEIRHEQFTLRQTHRFQMLANALFFNIPKLRGSADSISKNRMVQSGLWRFGISGDLPIVLVEVNDPSQIKLVREVLQAHHYLRQREIVFDVVVVNEYPGGYFQNFQEELDGLIRFGPSAGMVDKNGGIFLRSMQQLSQQELVLLQTISRVVLHGANGLLETQLDTEEEKVIEVEDVKAPAVEEKRVMESPAPEIIDAEFATARGGFTNNGKSYSLKISGHQLPPMPWSNIIANGKFGTLVTETGGGYTWSQNSRENRISPWSNDPITDPLGEVIYIRDVDAGDYWCATPRPIKNGIGYKVDHGFGYSKFSSEYKKIKSVLTLTVSKDDPVKWLSLKLTNKDTVERKFEVFFYIDWTLGVLREDSFRYIDTEFDQTSQTLYATNYYNNEFAGKVGYIGSNLNVISYTSDRLEFVGRNGDLSSPAIFEVQANVKNQNFLSGKKGMIRLSQTTGSGFDPCGAIKVMVTIEPGAEKDVLFYLGEADSLEQIKANNSKQRSTRTRDAEKEKTDAWWETIVSAIEIKTPERSFDILMNGWLLYQVVACRLFGRTGFYQSGGALGFRDQLQDVLALLAIRPDMVREQILLHASRQFVEGDVQHWWHPPTGRGVRTKISDDFLWLPFVTCRYIEATGDTDILNEEISFLEGPPLGEQHEAYYFPHISHEKGSLYEHCVRALERAMPLGDHGLPLIGCGDWNDGMNEVGPHGKGESVWLGWFHLMNLKMFAPFVQEKDPALAARHLDHAESLRKSIEQYGWDGKWYRRAFFDDGTPLGSAENDECRIDSLAQTWSIISGAGNKERSLQGMDEVYKQLVRYQDKIICLLTPPFNKSKLEPGYIKGYLPGVRENGGQYTHAGVWVVIATAILGRGDEALKLFELMNPIKHTANHEGIMTYKGEPYAMCGDVYAVAPHVGRAGWSWYTGSAGWLYQAGLEYILGMMVKGNSFTLNPTIPCAWDGFTIKYRKDGTLYNISVKNPTHIESGVKSVTVNGKPISDKLIILTPNSGEVVVEVLMGK